VNWNILLARDLGLITEAIHDDLAQRAIEVKRMLTSLRQKLTTAD
jgi:hypothetical protein